MAAVLAEGETIVGHAACEPHIQDLCRFLVSLGARIEGIGSNILRIEGVDRLGGGTHRIGSEHVEVASFAALAASTGGEVTIEDVEPGRPDLDRARLPQARDRARRGGVDRARPAGRRTSTSSTTSAARSRRSRAASGPPSRPT